MSKTVSFVARSQAPAWERTLEALASRVVLHWELVARAEEAGASAGWVPKLELGNQLQHPRPETCC